MASEAPPSPRGGHARPGSPEPSLPGHTLLSLELTSRCATLLRHPWEGGACSGAPPASSQGGTSSMADGATFQVGSRVSGSPGTSSLVAPGYLKRQEPCSILRRMASSLASLLTGAVSGTAGKTGAGGLEDEAAAAAGASPAAAAAACSVVRRPPLLNAAPAAGAAWRLEDEAP